MSPDIPLKLSVRLIYQYRLDLVHSLRPSLRCLLYSSSVFRLHHRKGIIKRWGCLVHPRSISRARS